MKKTLLYILVGSTALTACKKKGCTDEDALNYSIEAEKDDGSCEFLGTPSTYSFSDNSGNNTVSYSGQTERLDQLEEMITYAESGEVINIFASNLNDMFYNVGGNGNGNFTFTSSKQLADKCFTSDSAWITSWFDSIAVASVDHVNTASNGQAGVLTSGTSTYLFNAGGFDCAEVIEKSLIGAVFMNQALNHYLDDAQMNVDNTSAVDANAGKFYTQMEHHWDECFGYFGVSNNFPNNIIDIRFWGKYSNKCNPDLGTNSTMMNAFLNGRTAITENYYDIRDQQILIIRQTWERICAYSAYLYLEEAQGYFGNDDAKYLHALSEAYGFIKSLTYVPLETRLITYSQIDMILNQNFGSNLWNMGAVNLAAAKGELQNTYGF